MLITLRKIGNSKGIVIPAVLLQQLKADESDGKFEGDIINGKLVLEPVQKKKRYSLNSLLKKCDVNAPMPKELTEWDNIQPVGNEL